MPFAVLGGQSSAGTKTVTIPAPPSTKQSTFVDRVIVNGNNVSAAGVTYLRAAVLIAAEVASSGSATTFNLNTPGVSGASANVSQTWEFGPTGLQVRASAGTSTVTLDAVPSGNLTSMDLIVEYHHG